MAQHQARLSQSKDTGQLPSRLAQKMEKVPQRRDSLTQTREMGLSNN
jgi:hypothetical protein